MNDMILNTNNGWFSVVFPDLACAAEIDQKHC